MRRMIAWGAVLFTAVTGVRAEGPFLGWDESTTNHVASGTSVQSDAGAIGTGSAIYKTGAGTWDVSSSVLRQNGGTIGVREGALKLTLDDLTGAQAALAAPDVLDKAFLHLDMSLKASCADLFTGSDSAVECWYDAREEAGRQAPAHPYAKAVAYGDLAASAPEVKTFGGKTAMWFGGLNVSDSRFMHLLMPDGSFLHDQSAIRESFRHLFAVHAVTNSLGLLFGYDGSSVTKVSTGLHYFPSSVGGQNRLYSTYVSTDLASGLLRMIDARCYENGSRIDGFNALPVFNEPTVFELDTTRAPIGFTSLFTGAHLASCTGGDYLYEVVAFTNQLAETERALVSEYLRRKWGVRNASVKEVALAAGTSAELNATDAGTVSLSGSGDVTKTGAATLAVRTAADAPFTGTVDLQAGGVRSVRPVATTVPSGSRVTAAADGRDTLVTLASGTVGQLAKAGDGAFQLAALPSGTTAIRVEAGTLGLGAPTALETLDTGADYVVPLKNPSFEEYFTGSAAGAYAPYFSRAANNPANGWYGYFYYINFKNWTFSTPKQASGQGLASEAKRSSFGFKWDAPAGDSVLGLRSSTGSAAQSVVLPSAGTYRLTGRLSARNNNHGSAVDISLVASDSTVYSLGAAIYQNDSDNSWLVYAPFAVEGTVPTAGTYTLKLASRASNGDCLLTFDDLKLVRLAGAHPGVVKVPGGDFEDIDWVKIAKNAGDGWLMVRYNATNCPSGWTYTQPSGATDASPGVAASVIYSRGNNNASDMPYGGQCSLFYKGKSGNGAKAATTFSSPVTGTYCLRARFVTQGSAQSGLTASVSVGGGAEETLGTVWPTCRAEWRRYNWTKPLALSAGDSVTLTLTGVGNAGNNDNNVGGLHVDDLELVPVDETVELVNDGSFEASTYAWTTAVRKSNWENRDIFLFTSDAVYDRVYAKNYPAYQVYGASRPDGIRAFVMNNWVYAKAKDAVTVAEAGFYDCSFLAHRIVDTTQEGKTGRYHAQKVRLWLEDTTTRATNVLVEATADQDEFTRYSSVKWLKPGSYAVYIEGMSAGGGGSGGEGCFNIHAAIVDDLSIRRSAMNRVQAAPSFANRALEIDVAEGAKLDLAFVGTNRVGRLKLGGTHVIGVVSAATHPDYVSGSGALEILPKGLIVLIK